MLKISRLGQNGMIFLKKIFGQGVELRTFQPPFRRLLIILLKHYLLNENIDYFFCEMSLPKRQI